MTPRHPAAVAIVERVAELYGVEPSVLWGGKRLRGTVAEARHLVWAKCKESTGWTWYEMGKAFGVDHTSVVAGLRSHRGRVVGKLGSVWLLPVVQALDEWCVHVGYPVGVCGITTGVSSGPSCAPAASPSGISDSGSQSSSALSSDLKEPVSKPAREPKKPKPDKWRRVQEVWQPNDKHREIALHERVDLHREVAQFRDHEFATPRSDPDAAFRVWLRRASEFAPRGAKPPGQVKHERLRAEENAAQPRRPELAMFKAPRPVQEATPLEVLAAVGQVLHKPPAPPVAPARRMTTAELDRAVEEMSAGRKT